MLFLFKLTVSFERSKGMNNRYIPPQDVTSPQDRWNLNCVVYDGGPGNIAVALGQWNENENENTVIAIRWNGNSRAHEEVGNPQSRGHPTWFILPNDFGVAVIKELMVKRAAGNTSVRQDCLAQVIGWMCISQELE